MTETAVVTVEHVSHRYGGRTALDDVCLEFPSRRMVGLIGPDGVGKSTLLGLIAGVRTIQQGVVRAFDGSLADAAHLVASRRRIAYMLQGLGRNLYPTLSVFETIDFFGRLFGQHRARGAHRRTVVLDRPRCVPRSARGQTVWRDEAKAEPVLHADAGPRPLDPRRTDHRRRSAVAPAVLGFDQHHLGAGPR